MEADEARLLIQVFLRAGKDFYAWCSSVTKELKFDNSNKTKQKYVLVCERYNELICDEFAALVIAANAKLFAQEKQNIFARACYTNRRLLLLNETNEHRLKALLFYLLTIRLVNILLQNGLDETNELGENLLDRLKQKAIDAKIAFEKRLKVALHFGDNPPEEANSILAAINNVKFDKILVVKNGRYFDLKSDEPLLELTKTDAKKHVKNKSQGLKIENSKHETLPKETNTTINALQVSGMNDVRDTDSATNNSQDGKHIKQKNLLENNYTKGSASINEGSNSEANESLENHQKSKLAKGKESFKEVVNRKREKVKNARKDKGKTTNDDEHAKGFSTGLKVLFGFYIYY